MNASTSTSNFTPNLSLKPFRPIVIGIAVFMILNLLLTVAVTASPLNSRFNFSYGNFLPVKMQQLQASDPDRLNVLFLGTSQTNNGFATPVFESEAPVDVNSFNMGLPSNRYDIMLSYLKYHNKTFGKPQVVLLELSPSIQERKDTQYYLPALYYRSIVERDFGMSKSILDNPLLSWNVKKELLLSSVSSLHQFRMTFSPMNILGKVTAKISEKLKGCAPMLEAAQAAPTPTAEEDMALVISDDHPQKGWYPKEMEDGMRTAEGFRTSLQEAKKYFIDSQQEISFAKIESLLAYCEEQNIQVVLVTWPNHPEYLKLFEESKLARAYHAELARLLEKHDVHAIDLNQRMLTSGLQVSGLFSDPRHLTPEGAKLFTTELSRQVFSIPSVRERLTAAAKKNEKATDGEILTYEYHRAR